MKTIFSIGHYSINVFGLFIAIGLMIGYLFAMREAKRKSLNTDVFSSIVLYSIIFGIIGARLYYVLVFNFDYYISNPSRILAFRDGGLSIQGALIGGIAAAVVYTKIKKINLWQSADTAAPGIIIGQAIGRIGCDVFGIAMSNSYFWGITHGGQILHPAQIYESLLNFVLFGVIWAKRKTVKYDGQLFFIYLIGFSINRFIIEFFRTNPVFFGPFTVAHATSIFILAITLIAMKFVKKKNELDNREITKKWDISPKEILAIIAAMVVAVILYYYWVW